MGYAISVLSKQSLHISNSNEHNSKNIFIYLFIMHVRPVVGDSLGDCHFCFVKDLLFKHNIHA